MDNPQLHYCNVGWYLQDRWGGTILSSLPHVSLARFRNVHISNRSNVHHHRRRRCHPRVRLRSYKLYDSEEFRVDVRTFVRVHKPPKIKWFRGFRGFNDETRFDGGFGFRRVYPYYYKCYGVGEIENV